ncbi:MAG: molybdopterin-dependent oxidoreductase [Chloroflexi bacterium]|nr:molybdopterin-dependent oxidoreductase [Chloroflexota bacterium]
MSKLSFALNGKALSLEVNPRRRLLDVLRQDLDLTGAKDGCSTGHCGSCAVIIDGAVVNSCLVQIGKVVGKEVTTIEGLGAADSLHPLQQAFVETGAVQCGFCTPGMVLAAKVLLDRNPSPDQEVVKEALGGNLCRCTGYVKIIEAVMRASRMVRGEAPKKAGLASGVGARVAVLDGIAKAGGQAKFAADMKMEGMLYAQVLRSPHPHALISAIDTSQARSMPGVRAILTVDDIPGAYTGGRWIKDQPVLAHGKVRYVGEPVAVVAATDEVSARKAAKAIKVDYQVLPPVFEPTAALGEDAPRLHEGGNLLFSCRVVKGDVEQGFREAEVIVENTYSTPFIEHAYLEPEAGMSYIDEEGRVVVCSPIQNLYFTRSEIARILGVEPDRARMVHTVAGGGFGGKLDMSVQPLLALLTFRTGRPVKMVYSRKESFLASGKRHPFSMKYRLGATRQGRLTALQVEIVANTGAYASAGPGVLMNGVIHASGAYYFPNVLAEGKSVYTNNPFCGAMRGFGVPQVTFAVESHMDILARELKMDPLELRLLNAFRPGLETATGQILGESVGIGRTIEEVRGYYTEALSHKGNGNTDTKRGVGVASAWFGIGPRFVDYPSEVDMELRADGRVSVSAGGADMGQGLYTVLAQIASEELKLPLDAVVPMPADTASAPDAGPTIGSRQTYTTGNAARLAAIQLRKALLEMAARAMELKPESLTITPDGITSTVDPLMKLSWKELAAVCREAGVPPKYRGRWGLEPLTPDPQTGRGTPYETYVYATDIAEVEVNVRTGAVKVLRLISAQDVGKALNPLAVEGQMEGGIVMGLGYALKEEFIPGKTYGFGQYKIPNMQDIPDIVPIIVEVPEPTGPYGAKGVGEIPVYAVAPAIANAIYDACGARVTKLPATPRRVLEAMARKASFIVE